MRTRRPMPMTRPAGLAVAVLLLAGCAAQAGTADAAAGGPPSSSAAAEEAATPSVHVGENATDGATDSATDGAEASPFPGDTRTDVADPVAPEGLTVTTVRAARHDGFDRVVFELAGSGTPGWTVEYVDSPSAQGSGHPVDVAGAAHLQVTLQGTSYPYESGATELARGPVDVPGTSAVRGVFYDATFEGSSVAWVGTSGRAPFRVYALTGPSRVVVEVADAG